MGFTQKGYAFAIEVRPKPNLALLIGVEEKIDKIVIYTSVELSEEDRTSYLLTKDKRRFWLNLRMNLIVLGINTKVEPSMETLKKIELTKIIENIQSFNIAAGNPYKSGTSYLFIIIN